MNTNRPQPNAMLMRFSCIAIVWTIVLLVSDLPDAIWQALTDTIPTWLFWVKMGILFIMIILTWIRKGWILKQLYSLRSFFILLLILFVGLKTIKWFRITESYVQESKQLEWLLQMATFIGMELLLIAVMVVALLIMKKRRQDFFLAKGSLGKWKIPGVILALSIMILTFFFFDYDLPSSATLLKALPLIPAALLFAALFAFNEEMLFRSTLLSSLYDVVGKGHSIMITAFFFGMAHYFGGTPSGIEGVLIGAALGGLWATITLETRSIYMSWLIHFLNNIPTLIFWAIASISV